MTLNILAIDDEPDTLKLLELRFRREVEQGTYRFFYASNGQEGLSQLTRNKIDLALVDLRMPRMGGLEFLERTGELYPELMSIVVSAFGDMVNLRQAMRNGAFDFVCKPVDFADLKQTLQKAERFLARQQLARRTRDSLLAVMNHELRTPLNGVIGMADFVAGQVSDPLVAESLQVIRESGHSLLDLFTEMIDYSTSDRAGSVQQGEELALAGFLRSLVTLYRPMADLRKIRLILDLEPDLPPLLLGDKVHLSQILTHLLSNALKFSSEGGDIKLHCAPAGQEAGQPVLRFEVIDQGRGIAPEFQQEVFEPFFQVDGSITRTEGGLGLGLSIARSWVERLGGRLELESRPGEGCRFWFELPFKAP